MEISNRRIIDFCTKHPMFNVENVLLLFIDCIENAYSSTIPSLDSTLASQIVSGLKSLEEKVHGLDSTISIKQLEYYHKSMELKREYIDDVKNILTINNTEKLLPVFKENNEIFINKLTLLFKEIIPKEQQVQTEHLQSNFKCIEQIISHELNKGVTKESIDNILSIVEQKVSVLLSAVADNKKDDQLLTSKIDEMLEKLGNKTSTKGKISENMLRFNLQAVYPTAEIRNVSGTPHHGDFWILRKDKPSILIENKNHESTVPKDEVQKFIDNMNTQDMSGILISQKSKIVFRDNYEIEIYNGNIAVYINECNYDPYKIKIAVQIIDVFKQKIEKQKIEYGSIVTIDVDVLHRINKEFQLFNIKKTQHVTEIKTMCETLIKSAEDMEFNSLDEFLESQGLLTNVKKFICGNCPRTFKTRKGLDTHERQCTDDQLKKKGNKCEYCEQEYPTLKGLRTHVKKKHDIEMDSQSENSDN
jgi:hypothetical protein